MSNRVSSSTTVAIWLFLEQFEILYKRQEPRGLEQEREVTDEHWAQLSQGKQERWMRVGSVGMWRGEETGGRLARMSFLQSRKNWMMTWGFKPW